MNSCAIYAQLCNFLDALGDNFVVKYCQQGKRSNRPTHNRTTGQQDNRTKGQNDKTTKTTKRQNDQTNQMTKRQKDKTAKIQQQKNTIQ